MISCTLRTSHGSDFGMSGINLPAATQAMTATTSAMEIVGYWSVVDLAATREGSKSHESTAGDKKLGLKGERSQ